MIDNILIQCKFCNCKIRMRFQMGFFDIPFDFCCPECGVHIHGTRAITKSDVFTLNNANRISGRPDDADFYADFSVELPQRKITKFVSMEQLLKDGFSPFMMMTRLYPDDSYAKLMDKIQRLLSFRNNIWPKLLPLYDLFFNKRIDIAATAYLDLSNRFVVKNELDAAMALHQTSTCGLASMLSVGTLSEYTKYSERIITKLPLNQLFELINDLDGQAFFQSILKRLVGIYKRWFADLEKYIPSIMLSLGGAKEKFNKETHGIATTSFEDMKSFYSDSYELLLDMVDISVGLNNLELRGDHRVFSPMANVRSFSAYKKQAKSERLKSLIAEELFSKPIYLNRNVRNAIAHYDYEFDTSSQKIIFHDKYKSNEETVEIYLIDLSLLCYENMEILMYMNELMYTLRKLCYCRDGFCTSIQHSS